MESRADRVIGFIHRHCLVPDGKLVGKPMKLNPFQINFIRDVYDNPHGTSTAILCMGRKNGKTALIACLVLVHLVGPEARLNSEITSGARSRKQAAQVYKLASKMVQLSPTLRTLVHIKPSQKALIGILSNVEYEAISAEASTAHGGSPVVAILDEAGQVRGPQDDFVDAITTSQGAHDNPLLIVISTQAASDADLLSIWIDDARTNKDPHTVCHVYEAPAKCKLNDRKAWEAANPALGIFRSLADVEKQAAKAMRMPSEENTFRNLILNQRVERFSPFISRTVWDSCSGAIGDFGDCEIYAGLDLSARTDLTALLLIGKVDGVWRVKPYFWTPEDGLRERSARDRAPYDVWHRDGLIRTTPGASVDLEYVATDLGTILAPLNVKRVAFDRWRMDVLKKELERQSITLPLMPFGQGFKDMSPALDELENALLTKTVAHGGDPVLTMCAAGAVISKDAAGNRKLDKSKTTRRIDGMVALAMAFGAAFMKDEEATAAPSMYFL